MKSKIGLLALMVGMLIVVGSSCMVVEAGIAVSGDLTYSVQNPAGLSGLVTPEFAMKLRIMSENSQQYLFSYAEPDYGTGAGLIHFIWQDAERQFTYAVAKELVESADIGIALHYISYPEVEDKYISTDLGLQLNFDELSWLRFGLLAENFVHLKLGETEADLPTNITVGVAVDLAGWGVVTADLYDAWDTNSARNLKVGAEFYPIDSLTLRARWSGDLGLGIGYKHQQLRIDYDWSAGDHQLGFGWQF
ncbi:MAG TPA: hypothetical protein GX019_02455 [Firmicutes bacterium]|nr:hypothetical protein [Bacillota bacterium]